MKLLSRKQFILSLGLGALLLDSLWFEKFFIEINEFNIGETKETNTTIKIIQLSDLHLNSIGAHHQRLFDTLNTLAPDLILFTGDSIDKAENLPLLEHFLKNINISTPKAAILGNWEYWGKIDLKNLNEVYKKYNCKLLVNQSELFTPKGKKISITGLDDYVAGNANFPVALKSYVPGDYHIVLTHCPEHRDIIAMQSKDISINLVLSGHTHGGQINILGYTPFKPPGSGNYTGGWYKESHPPLYVTKGIGTSILPIRFGARAEISVFNLMI